MTRCLLTPASVLATLLLLLTPAIAEEEEGIPTEPVIDGISFVCLTVDDQDKALAWYTETLGVTVTMDEAYGANGERWLSVTLPGQSPEDFPQIVLFKPDHAMEKSMGMPETQPATNLLLNTNFCSAMVDKLRDAGATIIQEATDKGYGIEAIWVDPFGNWITMMQPLYSDYSEATDPG